MRGLLLIFGTASLYMALVNALIVARLEKGWYRNLAVGLLAAIVGVIAVLLWVNP
jgi:hypothetical protein